MKALVAGFGNIFFSDDGYGNAAAQALMESALPPELRVVDFGIRGMHAAFEMLNGYDVVLFLDAMPRGEPPGTLTVIEPSSMRAGTPDAHAMELHNALAFYESLCRDMQPEKRPCILVLGCEPQCVDEGMGLSNAVREAVSRTPVLVYSILENFGIGAKHEVQISS